MMSDLLFEDEEDTPSPLKPPAAAGLPWVVLIVDDDPPIHEVTQLVMRGFTFDQRPIEFLNCYSAAEARTLLASRNDVALILLDVVMETEQAGLDLVRYIRDELKNHMVRIVLRTGQAGQAPEESVIRNYDINDYREKTELTKRKLHTVFFSTLRSYRDISLLDASRRSLFRSLDAITHIGDSHSIYAFSSTLLEQIKYLIGGMGEGLCANRIQAYAASVHESRIKVLAATSGYRYALEQPQLNHLPESVRTVIEQTLSQRASILRDGYFSGYYCTGTGSESVIYMAVPNGLGPEQRELLDMFSRNVAITYESLLLKEEIQQTQQATLGLVIAALEHRSTDMGLHFHHVGDLTAILARGSGLPEIEVEMLRQASMLHDVGLIALPELDISHPGPLSERELQEIQRHPTLGATLLSQHRTRILDMASLMSEQHHERWDGSGYPRGLKGTDISLHGRIAALADVFDALLSERPHRAAFAFDQAVEHIVSQSGCLFDPDLVRIFEENLEVIEQLFLASGSARPAPANKTTTSVPQTPDTPPAAEHS